MFNRLSIRYKLAILLGLSATTGLLLSLVIILYVTLQVEKDASLQSLHQVTSIISENTQAAVAFYDSESANKILQSLGPNVNILYALVIDDSFEVVGEYLPQDKTPQQLAALGAESGLLKKHLQDFWLEESQKTETMSSFYHCVAHKIYYQDQAIGAVLVVSSNDVMFAKMKRLGWIFLSVISLVIAGIILVSLKLQKIFTRPIYHLLRSMREIADTKNYTIELSSQRKDEFSELYQGFNGMLKEIHQRDQLLNQLATTDSLTQLSNRSFAIDALNTIVPRLQRQQQPLGIILLDVDHFKNINDQYGHAVGDLVLQAIAVVMRENARPYDVVARWGGEEFLIVCEDADLEATATIAERIRAQIEQIHLPSEQGCKVTASVGIYSAIPVTNFSRMIDCTDKALYQAKASGRNTVKVWAEHVA